MTQDDIVQNVVYYNDVATLLKLKDSDWYLIAGGYSRCRINKDESDLEIAESPSLFHIVVEYHNAVISNAICRARQNDYTDLVEPLNEAYISEAPLVSFKLPKLKHSVNH